MPKAIRKTGSAPRSATSEAKTDAKPLPVEDVLLKGERVARTIVKRDLLADMKDYAARPDDDVLTNKAKLPDWHHALAQVSGTLVLTYARGLNSRAARAMIAQLRIIADDMQGDLFRVDGQHGS